MKTIVCVAGALTVHVSLAAEHPTAREACEALSGLEISAARIGLPTGGARVENSTFE
jgi:hypothetical protein